MPASPLVDRENSGSECVAVVTGGQGALGQAIAGVFRKAGWTVHDPGRSELDVTSPESVEQFFGELGRIDLLVNNAGMKADRSVLHLTEAEWDAVMQSSLHGAWRCARAVMRAMMRQRSGHIVNIGSFSALAGVAGQAAYCSAKAGLIGLTQSLAKELGSRNVRVNCVLPGWMETKFTADVPPEALQRALDAHVLGRFNRPAEAAQFVFALEQMSAVSGQVFQLDSRIGAW